MARKNWLVAASLLKYVTRFSCDTFGFYVAAVYVQYGIQVVTRQFGQSSVTSGILGVLYVPLFNSNVYWRQPGGDYNDPTTLLQCNSLIGIWKSTYTTFLLRLRDANNNHRLDRICILGTIQSVRPRPFFLWLALINRWIDSSTRQIWHYQPTLFHSKRRTLGAGWLGSGNYQGNGSGLLSLSALCFGYCSTSITTYRYVIPFSTSLGRGLRQDEKEVYMLILQSLIAQGSEFPLRKPPGFHWDFFLLGFVIFASGILGLPASNGMPFHLVTSHGWQLGLIPQAPLHTSSLTVMGWEDDTKDPQPSTETNNARELPASYPRTEGQYDLEMRNLGSEEISIQRSRSPVDGLRRRLSRDPQVRMEREKEEEKRMNQREVPVAVVEQRLSNLAQGCLCTFPSQNHRVKLMPGLVLMTSPFQHVLGLIPKGVLAGLFVCPPPTFPSYWRERSW